MSPQGELKREKSYLQWNQRKLFERQLYEYLVKKILGHGQGWKTFEALPDILLTFIDQVWEEIFSRITWQILIKRVQKT